MLVVGLTGGIGSGKSTVASLFMQSGATVIDADSLAREVVAAGSEALTEISSHFGSHLLDTNGELRRAELRKIVFADATERVWLEQLLHPLIANLMQQRIVDCESTYCILESPLLLETNQHELVDRVLLVDVSEHKQLQRALLRDGSDEATIKGIIAAQMPRSERLKRADDVIDNDQQPEALSSEVNRLHEKYLAIAGEKK